MVPFIYRYKYNAYLKYELLFLLFSYPDVTVIQQMQEEQQSQPRPSPVHIWSQSQVILTPPAHQLHSPQNCESSQNTSQDP